MRWIDAGQWGTARNLGSIDGVCSGSDRCQAVNVQSLNAIKCSFDCPALCLPWGWSGVVNFVHPLHAAHASPSLREGEEKGVLCFFLGSRVRGNDGVARGNDGGLRE